MQPVDENEAAEATRRNRRAEEGEDQHWSDEHTQARHHVDVDVALIDRFNPEGRGAALLKAM